VSHEEVKVSITDPHHAAREALRTARQTQFPPDYGPDLVVVSLNDAHSRFLELYAGPVLNADDVNDLLFTAVEGVDGDWVSDAAPSGSIGPSASTRSRDRVIVRFFVPRVHRQ